MLTRLASLRRLLLREKLDGFLVSGGSNLRWLCGYTGSNGMMLVTLKDACFYTDFRYKEQIRTEVKGCRKRVLERDLYTAFPVEDCRRVRRLGFEPANLSVARFTAVRRQLKKTKLVASRDLILELRRAKEAAEVAKIQAAQNVVDRTFKAILDLIKPGVTERDLALEIEFRFRARGDVAFPSIVASGPNSAKPHAGASSRRLRRGDAITFDIGCRLDGYCSDMTRTVFLGRPDPELREIYFTVLEAQQQALAVIKPGVPCKFVDLAARDYLTGLGYGHYFGHSLGHGVGLDVHEQPMLAHTSPQILEPGDITTVEPGVYVPGLGGVRIEDMVLVTRTGCRNLTASPKKLTIL
ncbi:MAG: Xaa-Pro peptidase family protein [candidate division WOR-3 bacterium]